MGLNDNLEAFWKLDEASGSRADSSGNSRTLTDNNTVTQATGKVGNAAQFTAANSEYLSAADAAWCSFGNESFTVAAWIYIDSAAAEGAVVGKNTEWRCTITTGRKARLTLPSTALNHADTLSLSTWYHVVWQYDAAADLIRIYVNAGTPTTTSDTTGATDSTNELRLGRQGSAYYDGRIDAVGIWRRALSADEITTLYNSGNGVEPPFTTAYTATLTETLTASDSIVKGTGRALTESATITDSLTKGTVRTLAEAPTLGDAISRDIGRTVDDGAVLSDTVTRGLARTLSEDSTLSDEISRALAREVSEALGVEDTISRGIARAFVESYTATDGRLDAVARTLTETLGLSDTITVEIIRLFGRVARPRTELLTARRTTELRSGPRTTEIL